jgi:hypothetical protein
MATAVLAGAGMATAEPRYHLVLMPDGAGYVTNSGVVLSGMKLLDPVRDVQGKPVWDTDGDDVADSYAITILDPGLYSNAQTRSINESLDVAGYGTAADGNQVALLWRNTPSGHTLVELGRTFTDAEVATFTDVQINALSINDLGKVLVYEYGFDPSRLPSQGDGYSDTFALALVNPEDTDGDGVGDVWNRDDDGDGTNDLMIELEYGASWGGSLWGEGSINNGGRIAAFSNLRSQNCVVVPMDTDGNGVPDLWFVDDDGDGWNDLRTELQSGLGQSMEDTDISDTGVVVSGVFNHPRNYILRWHIDEVGNVELVDTEHVDLVVGVNNQGRIVGLNCKSMPDYHTKYTTVLWEPDGSIIDLLDLLDNPSRTLKNLRALNISDTGYIVGLVYTDEHWPTAAFIAVPITQSPPGPGPGPSVDSISPDTMQAGTSIDVTISGSGFVDGAESQRGIVGCACH